MIMAVIAIICTLFLVVGIHEGGHALAARFFGVYIQKISIGFGHSLLRWRSQSGCEWIWAAWPLGGYVLLLNSRISPVDPKEYPVCFDKKPVWVRVLILLAGVFANLVTAWIAFVLVFYLGITYRAPQIQSVQANSIAAQAGINPGDQLIAVEGRPTASWQNVGTELVLWWGKKQVNMALRSADNKQLKEIHLDLSKVQFSGPEKTLLAGLGIAPNLSAPQELLRFPSLSAAITQTNQTIAHTTYFFMMILKQLFSGVIPFSVLLGPLGLLAVSVSSFTQGLVVFLFFIAHLSLAVALINILPVPGLDGGSIVYALIELIRGKPISVAMEVLLHRLIFILFAVVLVHLLMNDLSRFIH